jgi:enoyl-CoA hydratase
MNDVHIEAQNGVATLTLNAPARLNAITPEMADDIAGHCRAVEADSTIAALVVCGAGDSFCSGADLSSLGEVSSDPLRDDNFDAIERIYRAFLAIEELDVLTLAAARGAAVGAGLNLLLATDIRIVARDARLMSGFVKKGLHPGGGHFDLLARSSSPQVACALGLAGQRIDGTDAVRLGLAWEAVDAADVRTRAKQIADNVAAQPAVARAAKRSIRLSVTERATRRAAVQIERVQQLRTVRRVGSAVTQK